MILRRMINTHYSIIFGKIKRNKIKITTFGKLFLFSDIYMNLCYTRKSLFFHQTGGIFLGSV